MVRKNFLSGILCLVSCFSAGVLADVVKLKADHPQQHIVVKGDTLWDISAKFLDDPWLWPEIWQINPDIENPHLIFPGDVILLVFVDGQPKLKVERGVAVAPPKVSKEPPGDGRPTVRLTPAPIYSKLENAIPTIPIDAVEQFLQYPRIVGEKDLDNAPYIVASEDKRLISGATNKVYVRRLNGEVNQKFNVVRPGNLYRNPKNKKDILGREVLQIGTAEVLETGDPSTLNITHSSREILIGDLLLPVLEEQTVNTHFLPHAPDQDVHAQIVAVLDGVSRIGQFQTVVIDRGSRDGFEIGHVLAIYQAGDVARDRIGPRKMGREVQLPDERAGTLMVVRLFDRLCYALVMEATRDVRVLDYVRNP